MKLDPDGTHPVTWHREEESRNRFPGSHCPELGRAVCLPAERGRDPGPPQGVSIELPHLASNLTPLPIPFTGCCQKEPHTMHL